LLANDLSAYETDKYKIKIAWKVPRHHSRRDWIGLYRVGANQSSLVTRTSSLGMWMPVHDKEWDGDFPIGEDINSHTSSTSSSSGSGSGSSSVKGDGSVSSGGGASSDEESGTVVFQGDALPWTVGRYEVRYHHDGMYNVLALDGPIEIYEKVDFESFMPVGGSGGNEEGEGGDPDDFRFWSERQAWRIARAIREMFGVEYAPDVVVADANLSALAQRIITSRQIIMQG
ncbi:hypothetical protein B0F90DRAFT_1669753, partial [Multifurca ochricompacta]